jgi:signal transduction histidine kinase
VLKIFGKEKDPQISNSQQVFIAQIRALYRHTPMVLAVNVVNSGLVALALASYLEQTRWWIFFGLVTTLTVVRAIGWKYYYDHRKSADFTRMWAIIATAGSGFSGLLWGISSTMLLPNNLLEQTFLAFVIGGMCAGALVSLSYYLPAFIGYVYFSALPLAAGFLLDDGKLYVAMGCMVVVFVGAVTFAAHHFNRAFLSSVRLNLDLFDRTEELTGRTNELIEVNTRLQSEITQREAAETQLRQAQKMEALGQLTGGIAHDFNNLLAVIIGNIELMQLACGDAEKIKRLGQAAIQGAQRGERLVRQLLTYARRQSIRPETVNPNQLIADIENLMGRAIGEQIEMTMTLSPLLAPAEIDPTEFETAILNLVINSRDAMTGGGRITIETQNVTIDRQFAASNPEVTPGPYVMIAVSDSGTGMPPAVLARAFDPFFTTKEVGKGSGLGLSQVYGFAKTAGGHVTIESELGIGTTVKVYLPKASDRPIMLETGNEAVSLGPASSHETILVVEDDEDVLTVAAESLRGLGYQVETAVNAAQALDILRGDHSIDLLFSDVIMPGGMNGVQLTVEARRIPKCY